jgi:prolipoprotein diacylglyceryl transferase
VRSLLFVHDFGVLAAIGWKVLDRFHIGSRFAISPHGVGIAVGYLCGAWVFMHEGPKRGISEERASSVVLWGLVGAIVGARVGYILSHLSEFHSIGDVLAIYRGGISLIGGIIGWVVVAGFILRRYHLSILRTFDAAAMPLAVGIVIGRVGDLIIGDHLGKPTSWAFAFQYWGGNLSGYDCVSNPGTCVTVLSGGHQQIITHNGARLVSPDGSLLATGVGVHQTALYDFVLTMGLVLLLLILLRKPRRAGILTATFVIWYATGRILTDAVRVERRFLHLTGSQWACAAAVLLCLGLLVYWRFSPLPEGSDGSDGSNAPDESDVGSPASDAPAAVITEGPAPPESG